MHDFHARSDDFNKGREEYLIDCVKIANSLTATMLFKPKIFLPFQGILDRLWIQMSLNNLYRKNKSYKRWLYSKIQLYNL